MVIAMKEFLDIVNAKGEPTGQVVARDTAHENGIWHRTSHVWLVRRKNGTVQILLQKRTEMKSFPGCYDISSAGHIPAGEDFVTSALRELKEELGVTAKTEELIFCGDRKIVSDDVFFATANRFDEKGNGYYMETMEQLNPAVFSWLDLLDMNVIIIILLMLAVSGFSIISGLIILILDSIQLVGVLKALGATNKQVRGVFITQGVMLIGKGVIWGNILGLVLCAIQYFGHILPLDATTYYVNYVPIAFPIGWLLLLNVGTILVSTLILLAPSAIITKISPSQVMRFE